MLEAYLLGLGLDIGVYGMLEAYFHCSCLEQHWNSWRPGQTA
jgi:hypothetical protein